MKPLAPRAGRIILLMLLLLAGCELLRLPAAAQTLARRGWAGAPISLVPWWRDAVFFETTLDQLDASGAQVDAHGGDASTGEEALLRRLDRLHDLGIDALILAPAPPATAVDRFDRLISEASRRRLRVLVALPVDARSLESSGGLEATARAWLGRGAGGFRLAGGDDFQIGALRRVCASFVGDRVLLGPQVLDAPQDLDVDLRRDRRSPRRLRTRTNRRRSAAQLTAVPLPEAQALTGNGEAADRFLGLLGGERSGAAPAPLGDVAGMATAEVPLGLALLFLSRGAPVLVDDDLDLLTAGDDPSPAGSAGDASSETDGIRRLAALKHGEPAIHDGALLPLHLQGSAGPIVGWLRRPARGGPLAAPVLVLCNLTGERKLVSVTAELARLHALPARRRARTLLRSGAGATASGDPGVDLGAIPLEPFGVYAGAVGRGSGLETTGSPGSPRRSGRISR